MSLIPFPNVPNVSGVPSLPRSTSVLVSSAVALGAVQGALWAAAQSEQRWGIFDAQGRAVVDPSNLTGMAGTLANSVGAGSTLSVVSFEYSNQTRISEFPIERGSFTTYNKIGTPADVTVSFAFSGSESDRAKFLDQMEVASESYELYNVSTPEKQYIGYSIEAYSYRRMADQGATLLRVDVTLKEIRQVSAMYSSSTGQAVAPKKVDAAGVTNVGKVQPINPTKAAFNAVANKFSGLVSSVSTQIATAVN